MIEVIYKCNKCGHNKGNIVTGDRATEVECKHCGIWETMTDETTEKNYSEVIFKGDLQLPPIQFD